MCQIFFCSFFFKRVTIFSKKIKRKCYYYYITCLSVGDFALKVLKNNSMNVIRFVRLKQTVVTIFDYTNYELKSIGCILIVINQQQTGLSGNSNHGRQIIIRIRKQFLLIRGSIGDLNLRSLRVFKLKRDRAHLTSIAPFAVYKPLTSNFRHKGFRIYSGNSEYIYFLFTF